MKISKNIGAVMALALSVKSLGITTDCSDGDLVDLTSVLSRARVLIPQSEWLLNNDYSGVAEWKNFEHYKFDAELVTVEKTSLVPTLEIHQILSHCSKPPYDEDDELLDIEYTEYDLLDSESLVSKTDIS